MASMTGKIRLGLDFDGVVAYNPFRLVRAPWAFFKNRFLGVKKLSFFYPKNQFEKMIWIIMHDSSILPARGSGLLRELVDQDLIEVHLISGRYSFLDNHLYAWLDRFGLRKIFRSINFNEQDKQPHLFKETVIKKLGVDIFIEDNWDIVDYLDGRSKAQIYWIYNIVDRFRPYDRKYPYLEKALEAIMGKKAV